MLSDPKWQGVGAIASVGAFLLAYAAFVDRPTPETQAQLPNPLVSQVTSSNSSTQPSEPESRIERRRPPDTRSADHEGGGVRIVVSGLGAANTELRSAVLSELRDLGWRGLTSSGAKELHVSGIVRDAGLTVGVPTAEGSGSWELRTRAGQLISQGGVTGRLGTGMNTEEAQSAAMRLVARKIAEDIVGEEQ